MRAVSEAPQYWSEHPVEAGAETRGLATPSSNHGVHVAEVWQGRSGLVCLWGVKPLSHLVRPYTSSSIGVGWDGTDVTEASSVHLTSAPGSLSKCLPRQSPPIVSGSILASVSLVPRSDVSPGQHLFKASRSETTSVSSVGVDCFVLLKSLKSKMDWLLYTAKLLELAFCYTSFSVHQSIAEFP